MPRIVPLAALLLAACAGPRQEAAPAEGPAAERAACLRACNREHAVCGDSSAAGRGQGPFSGSATCDRQLRQCTAACGDAK
jgi:hypothetical protein